MQHHKRNQHVFGWKAVPVLTNKNKDITLQIVAFVISDDESISKFKIDSLHWVIGNVNTKRPYA